MNTTARAHYVVFDVFTAQRFGGNQLAVFTDATNIPEDRLQSIAKEFNFSEVTFVYPPAKAGNTAKVRIFTPTMEVPFAGHPTVGTAVALRANGAPRKMVLELGIGPIPVTMIDDDTAEFVTQARLRTFGKPSVATIAACLGLPETAVVTSMHPPVQASLGLPFALVHIKDTTALSQIVTNVNAFRTAAKDYPGELDFAIYAYTPTSGVSISARMFAPLDNIPEDPATGSAAATLGAYLSSFAKRKLSLEIAQGLDMGRPSTIHVTANTDGTVAVRGGAVKVMEGDLFLPAKKG